MKILTVPNPVLRQKSKPIEKIDKKIVGLIKNMSQALNSARNPEGGALAASQIGKLIRLFIIDFDKLVSGPKNPKTSSHKKLVAFINPKITHYSKETLSNIVPKEKRYLEGCLSVPNFYGFINRPYKITVCYQTLTNPCDPQTKTQKTENFEGLEATFIQHEYDHLDGILFTDHVLAQKGTLYELRKGKEGKEEFVEVRL